MGDSFPRRRKAFALGAAAVVLVAGVITVVALTRTPDPVEVVRQYFAAIRQRDVDKALRVAGVDRPAGKAATFLVPEALSSDWDVIDIALDEQFSRDAWVTVTLPMYPESEAEDSRGGTAVASETVKLSKEDSWGGRWRIDNPFSWTLSDASWALRYFEVNGKVVEGRFPDDRSGSPRGAYVMLPGVYTFYRTKSDLASFEPVKLTLLPGVGAGRPVRGPAVTATAKTKDAVQREANAYLDRCVTRRTTPGGVDEPCPFGLGRNWSVETPEGEYRYVRGARWKVLRYPILSVSASAGGMRIQVTQPGAVQVTGTGYKDGRSNLPFTAQCVVDDLAAAAGLVPPPNCDWTHPTDRALASRRDGRGDDERTPLAARRTMVVVGVPLTGALPV